MKPITRTRTAIALAVIAFGILLGGCIPKRVLWSPDGQQAAVLGENGLYLCDTNGKISALLVPDVYAVDWFRDSKRLAVIRRLKYEDWTTLQAKLPLELRNRIVGAGQKVVTELKAGREYDQAFSAGGIGDGTEMPILSVYLKSLDGMKELSSNRWSTLQTANAEWIILQLCSVADGKATLGRELFGTSRLVTEIRVAPGGQAIAFTLQAEENGDYSMQVVSTDGSSPPQQVAEHTAWYPDWSKDGRSLVYIKTATVPKQGSDDVTLGSLARRKLITESGKVELQSNQEELAGLLFYGLSKVRCLADGRIVFSTASVHLPSTSAEMPKRQQLYALDPERQSTLTPLIPESAQASIPDFVGLFESSPDGKRVSIFGEKGEVVVLTLASGKVDVVQSTPEIGGNDSSLSVPVWRSNDELSFISFQKSNSVVRAEVALWRDGTNRVISSSWPTEVREKFLEQWVLDDKLRLNDRDKPPDKPPIR